MKMRKMKKMMTLILGLSLVTAMSAGPVFAADKMPAFKNNKQMVEYFGMKYSISTIHPLSTV